MDLGTIVGENIKARRKALGYSATQLSNKMGKPGYGSQVCAWERGKFIPGAYCLCELADALNCTVDDLLGRG